MNRVYLYFVNKHLSSWDFKELQEVEDILATSIFSFSNKVSYLSKTNFKFSVKMTLSSANAYNLDKSNIL